MKECINSITLENSKRRELLAARHQDPNVYSSQSAHGCNKRSPRKSTRDTERDPTPYVVEVKLMYAIAYLNMHRIVTVVFINGI